MGVRRGGRVTKLLFSTPLDVRKLAIRSKVIISTPPESVEEILIKGGKGEPAIRRELTFVFEAAKRLPVQARLFIEQRFHSKLITPVIKHLRSSDAVPRMPLPAETTL